MSKSPSITIAVNSGSGSEPVQAQTKLCNVGPEYHRVAEPHTLAEFAAGDPEGNVYHPKGRIFIGFWHPTPNFLKYLENRVSVAKIRPGEPGFVNSYPSMASCLARFEQRLEAAKLAPKPRPDSLSEHITAEELEALIAYMDNPEHRRIGFNGSSDCRICGCVNGHEDVDDGTYVWPSGLVHYLTKHRVGLPEEFIQHCLSGGKTPVVERRSGFIAAVAHEFDSAKFDLPHVIKSNVKECKEHIEHCFRRCLRTDPELGEMSFPVPYDAYPVTCTLRNGRIIGLEVTGPPIAIIRQSPKNEARYSYGHADTSLRDPENLPWQHGDPIPPHMFYDRATDPERTP